MGRKSKESNQEPAATVKTLFSADNPFRRKSPPPAVADRPAPLQQPGLGSAPPQDKAAADGGAASEARKRKRVKGGGNRSPSPDSDPIPKKRNKPETGDEGESPQKKRRKRKRDELEEEYERRRYGAAAAKASDGSGEGGGAVAVAVVGAKRKAEDASSEMIATKDTFDDESKLLRTVFVGNLPLKTKRKAMLKEFARFGEVESVRIRSVPIVDSKIPRKGAIIKGKINDAVDSMHAYIVFKDEQAAHAALSHNMAEVGGNHIRVDMACPPRKKLKGEAPLYDRKRTLFVGNLPFDVKDEELYQLFCGSSQSESGVEAVRVIRDPHTSVGKGIAYVLFKTREAASSTVKKRDLKIRDRPLRLCHAKSDDTPSKRKDMGPKRDFPHKRMTPSSREASTGSMDKTKAAPLSYQGLRASKSGVVKKASFRPPSDGDANRGSKRAAAADQKVRIAKRPAVAARKAKLLNKRKRESGTPENTRQNKKHKKH